ncbi:MAG: NAD(P)-binding domain-containing protein [Bdellovibrio sp.]|nr:NAD(P)-binding domain-containing protein [Bdellovibrio sp.]
MTGVKTYCVIGAGFSGLGIAKAFQEYGISFDVYEKNSDIGGNWLNGVYDSTHIISPKKGTEFPDYPMPEHYPTFPTRKQVLDYLRSYADCFGLREFIRFSTEITQIKPKNHNNGRDGWLVYLGNGEIKEYTGVIIANGHHWDKKIPYYPGTFSGKTLHSKDYKNQSDIQGQRVLVVGAGNSGCDIAVETGNTGKTCFISMRRGYHFLPKTFFGFPVTEFDRAWMPVFAQKKILKLLLKVTHGSNARYGLPEPDHDLFDHHPILNSQLLYSIQHGRVRPKPDVLELGGNTVKFVDGTVEEIDTVVWATGFNASFPFLDSKLLDWENGVPLRVGSVLPPNLAGLYFFGLVQPRGGAGPLIREGTQLLAEMILTQEKIKTPLVDLLIKFKPASSRMFFGVQEVYRDLALAKLALRWIRLSHRVRLEKKRLPELNIG